METALSGVFGAPVRLERVSELSGDASTRRYYRVLLRPGPHRPSLVLMRYPDEIPPGEELPFLNVHRYLARAGVPVPEILLHLPQEKLLFLEDLGDRTLAERVREAGSPGAALPEYERSVEILARIQEDGTRFLDGAALPSRLAFDVRKFAEEIDFFFEHAVREYGGIRLPESEERALEDLFLPFLEEAASLPRVLAHRDYHSRNLMVLPPGRVGGPSLAVLDFQDARMGSVFYDLASLLRDSYVTLPDPMVESLAGGWWEAATASLRRAAGERAAFPRRLDLLALQRNVKAIGTFGNQAHNRGKRFYLRFIPPTVAHLSRNFERNREMRPLSRRLGPILAALAEKAASESSP